MNDEDERELRDLAALWVTRGGEDYRYAGRRLMAAIEALDVTRRERDRLREEVETLRFLLRGGRD